MLSLHSSVLSSVLLRCLLLAYFPLLLYKMVFWQLAVLFWTWHIHIKQQKSGILLKKIKHAHHYHCARETCYMRPVLHLREQFNWILIQLNSTFVKIKWPCVNVLQKFTQVEEQVQEFSNCSAFYKAVFSLHWAQFGPLFFPCMGGSRLTISIFKTLLLYKLVPFLSAFILHAPDNKCAHKRLVWNNEAVKEHCNFLL